MHMPKWSKVLISMFLILTTLVVCYAGHVDNIFGISLSIRASASSYKEKATSMIEFYKTGAELDHSHVAGDELYVFGVFVSNFLMPFQSKMGSMSSDSFASKMAQTFFGDAYTAGQFTDMKYTLGLVQSAQAERRQLRLKVFDNNGNTVGSGTQFSNRSDSGRGTAGTVSVNSLYMNFNGFWSEFFTGKKGETLTTQHLEYTYDGAPNDATVWQAGSEVFDAILGQILSIAPTQAGAYFGTPGNLTAPLFIDCFGNISDANGTLIIPACMNPYAFYNRYLDMNRNPQTKLSDVCPLQLPINNAFWMGTMVTPQDLTMRVSEKQTNKVTSKDENGKDVTSEVETTVFSLKEGLLALANLWYPLDRWSNSATVTVGLDTLTGSYLGVYFNSSINDYFMDAWAKASNNTEVSYNDLMTKYLENGQDGFYDAWRFVGGTVVPMGAVLDDIALFDTYNNFSDSVTQSITTMSMYRDKDTNTWWAAENKGTMVSSIARKYIDAANNILAKTETGRGILNLGEAYTAKTSKDTLVTYNSSTDTSKLNGYYNVANMRKIYNWLVTNANSLGNMENKADPDSLSKAMTDLQNGSFTVEEILKGDGSASGGGTLLTEIKAAVPYASFSHDLEGKASAVAKDAGSDLETEIARSAVVAAATGDYAWMTYLGKVQDGGSGDDLYTKSAPLLQAIDFISFDDAITDTDSESDGYKRLEQAIQPFNIEDTTRKGGGLLTGRPMDYKKAREEAAEFFSQDATILNHVFCQLAHPGLSQYTTYTNGWRNFFMGFLAVLCAVIIAVLAVICIVGTAGAALIVGIAVASVILITLAVIDHNNKATQSAVRDRLKTYYSKLSKGIGTKAYGAKYTAKQLGGSVSDSNAVAFSQADLYANYGITREDLNHKERKLGSANVQVLPAGSGESPQGNFAAPVNAFQLCYTLYSPYGSLGSALGAVSNLCLENNIVKGDTISTKVGSYITNDVNLWGGIYYAYMVDIFGLQVKDDTTLVASQLATVLPPVPSNLTNESTIDLEHLLNAGEEQNDDAYYEQKQKDLLVRMDEMTNPSSTNFVSKWINNTLNSWIIGAHKGMCQASESTSYSNIGSGARYTGYTGYLNTATLDEQDISSWVLEYYNIIFAAIMILIVILGICLIVSGNRSIPKTLLGILLMAVILFIPRLSVDSSVAVANNIAQSVFSDRFNFWAYVQYQQYMTKIENAEAKDDKIEFMIVTNMQQAKDYYDSGNGVTLKWMSPKKNSYWDQISQLKVEGNDSLNLSIFKWMMQGQFKQEIYSTDPLSTYLYRPFNDISMTARSTLTKLQSQGSPSWSVRFGQGLGSADTPVDRANLAYNTSLVASDTTTDLDIKPAVSSSDARPYIAHYLEADVWAMSTSNYVTTGSSTPEEYSKAYPVSSSSGANETVGISNVDPSLARQTYFLYTESPYYYFYFYFSEMAKQYTDGSIRKLLLNDNFFKYNSKYRSNATSKADVPDDTLMDFLDLEGLFTYVIPGLQLNNYYVDEWTDLHGRTVTASSEDYFKDDLKNIWNMYAPWADAMYDCRYATDSIRAGGIKHALPDAINPGSYKAYRDMVFSPADMKRNYVTEADLSAVEKKIMKVLEETYTDLMYLNNYSVFDNEVLISAMAMIATFNFNEQFSQAELLGDSITLYPTGFEIKNFSYDAYMRMALLNTTGESIFSEEDIYTTVISNTSFFTGLLLLLNDVAAIYLIPFAKIVCLLGIFFLGILICAGGFLNTPRDVIKFVLKHFIVPLIAFVAVLLGLTFTASLFVGEGLTTYVGSRTATVAIGDPTLTILLMLACNIVALFALYKIFRLLITAYKSVFQWFKGSAKGAVSTTWDNIKSGFKFGRSEVLAVGAGAAAATLAHNAGTSQSGKGSTKFIGTNRYKNANERIENAQSLAKYQSNTRTRGGASKTDPKYKYKGSSGSDNSTSAEDLGFKQKTLSDKASMHNVDGSAKHTLKTYADGSALVGKSSRTERKDATAANKELYKSEKKALRMEGKLERKAQAKENHEALAAAKKEKRDAIKTAKQEHLSNSYTKRKNIKAAVAEAKEQMKGQNLTAGARFKAIRDARSHAKELNKSYGSVTNRASYDAAVKKAKDAYKNKASDARLTFADKRKTLVENNAKKKSAAFDTFRNNKDAIRASRQSRIVKDPSNLAAGANAGISGAIRRKGRAASDRLRGVGTKVHASAAAANAGTIGSRGASQAKPKNEKSKTANVAFEGFDRRVKANAHDFNYTHNDEYKAKRDAESKAREEEATRKREERRAREEEKRQAELNLRKEKERKKQEYLQRAQEEEQRRQEEEKQRYEEEQRRLTEEYEEHVRRAEEEERRAREEAERARQAEQAAQDATAQEEARRQREQAQQAEEYARQRVEDFRASRSKLTRFTGRPVTRASAHTNLKNILRNTSTHIPASQRGA